MEEKTKTDIRDCHWLGWFSISIAILTLSCGVILKAFPDMMRIGSRLEPVSMPVQLIGRVVGPMATLLVAIYSLTKARPVSQQKMAFALASIAFIIGAMLSMYWYEDVL